MGSVLARLRPNQDAIASYVWLIKCVGDPVFCAPNIGTAARSRRISGAAPKRVSTKA